MNAVAIVVLASSVGPVALCVLGLVRAKDAFDRLHFPGAAALVGAPGVAAALGLAGAPAPIVIRDWLITIVLVVTGGIVTHAIARAEWFRRRGGFRGDDEED
jgi:multisubunit Na+/H+ antiporter MnhG subunit